MEKPESKQNSTTFHFCSFNIAERHFAVNLLDLREVCQDAHITPIYHSSDSVRGYMNIRGQIHLVLDLRVILGYPPLQSKDEHNVIIFKQHVGDHFGVLVDNINGVETVESHSIEEYHPVANQSEVTLHTPHLYSAVCKLDGKLMLILESRNFLSTIQ
ncbi:MAG: chemotaxis protein CheW [Oligoflexales bacterium]